MAGQRTTIADKLAGTKTGDELPPDQRTAPPRLLATQTEQPSRSAPTQAGRKEAVKAPAHPAANITIPTDQSDLDAVADACQRIILESRRVYEMDKAKSRETYFRYAGPAVRTMHHTKAFKRVADPETGENYRSFRKWLSDLGVSKSHGYRMLDESPVAHALRSVYQGPLESSQVEILAPVVRQHGFDSGRKLWQACAELGDTSSKALALMRDTMGLTVNNEGVEPPSPAESIPAPAREPALRLTAKSFNADRVREFARQQPDLMRLIISVGTEALHEIEPPAEA
ncbi:hypothetical protein [Streptomyces scabiei]|uniref:hypothetical protein n=1 Tax=Streptomyces scabiei TaxID=1930 RepID=UPI0013C511E3|nr:hypothetical protein [Streptomyces scabiei]MDX3208698.1 hypothetical protein [Streptomyces scabiei]